MIEAQKVELIYPDGTQAIKPFDLTIGKGELWYITGPSGSGKTSFLKMLVGEVIPTGGILSVLKTHISETNGKSIRRLRQDIGPVFQDFRVLEGHTVFENIRIGMRFLKISRTEMNQSAMEILGRVGLEHKANTLVDHLSWGERQRVGIARASVRKPKLIVADEPTGNLDHDNAVKILDLLESFVSSETTVIITTHATHLIEKPFGHQLIHMDLGNIKVEREV
ncbi:cell division ATP-binding protein FtsE [Fusibacter tunisiensis]|uniref:Cell division transport system ATP-binding protein n=1 Tax=Fusibacter tunisiensis TaxID=1008308 RepID=A0ABS2MRE3_9FIRM|nr:ATP-binding cassette domain-containing protein [Fusibacter tunisiensis]MBM7561984.1 cell division transport system ATP-binding protein [Fusibacter tunisiensis]